MDRWLGPQHSRSGSAMHPGASLHMEAVHSRDATRHIPASASRSSAATDPPVGGTVPAGRSVSLRHRKNGGRDQDGPPSLAFPRSTRRSDQSAVTTAPARLRRLSKGFYERTQRHYLTVINLRLRIPEALAAQTSLCRADSVLAQDIGNPCLKSSETGGRDIGNPGCR